MLGGITSGVVDSTCGSCMIQLLSTTISEINKLLAIFIVRVYATYSANKAILCFMISLLVAKEVIVIVRCSSPAPCLSGVKGQHVCVDN